VPYLVVYLVGVLIGIAVMRDPWPARIGTALVWPLGPMAFLVVVPTLLLVCVVLWPAVMLSLLAVLGLLFWLIS
jgi:hypothetical protein